MESGGLAPRIYNVGTREKWLVTSHTGRFTHKKSAQYPLSKWLRGPQSRSRCRDKRKSLATPGNRATIPLSSHPQPGQYNETFISRAGAYRLVIPPFRCYGFNFCCNLQSKFAQIRGATSPDWLNFIPWRLILVGPKYGTLFVFPLAPWNLRRFVGFWQTCPTLLHFVLTTQIYNSHSWNFVHCLLKRESLQEYKYKYTQTIKRRANWIGRILSRNSFPEHVIEGK